MSRNGPDTVSALKEHEMSPNEDDASNATGPRSHDTAAIDITTGHGANAYLRGDQSGDPWARECFISLVDGCVNHPKFYFPHPTKVSAGKAPSLVLPELMTVLMQRNLLSPHMETVAASVEFSDRRLNNHMRSFRAFANANPNKLLKLIQFHFRPEKISQHAHQFTGTPITPSVESYWHRSVQACSLADDLGVTVPQAQWAFDTFCRGQQYYEVLQSAKAVFFPHPIRTNLFADETRLSLHAEDRWSWGGLLATLIENDKLPRRLDELCEIIERIRDKTTDSDGPADWYQPMNVERHEEVAAELNLPAKIRESVVQKMYILSTVTASAADQFAGSLVAITLAVSVGYPELRLEERWVRPKYIGRFKVLRGCLYWPGARDNDTVRFNGS